MQLAATVQRAHPPPVPPRPSRQVVAEALKKSPRPPCPTRQAPPPPNQRPWRSDEQQQSQQSRAAQDGGRTIVYDSAHLQAKSNGKLAPSNERRQQPPASCKVVGLANGKAARIEDTSRRKAESAAANHNNNNNDHDHEGEDEEVAEKGRPLVEASADRGTSKKSVTFVEAATTTTTTTQAIAEEGSKTANKESCATVVVIDESEGSRVTKEESPDNIQRLDWLEAGVRYSATKITLPAEEIVTGTAATATSSKQQEMLEEEGEELGEEREGANAEFADLDFSSIIERIAMSSLQGLPPLPRSLSGFNLNGAGLEPPPPPPARSTSKASQRSVKTPSSTTSLSSQGSRPSPQGRQLTTLDTQLAILRREMFGLRQLDLSLLSQLWSLNESIQEFRQLLQEQEDRVPSPSPSSEEGDDTSYSGQPPPPPRRPPAHHRHHHRAARSSKLPPSDESPSSEEYGAV